MGFLSRCLLFCQACLLLPWLSHGQLTSEEILAEARDLQDWLVSTRRRLHEIPELSFKETLTSRFIVRKLDEMDVNYQHGYAQTGIVVKIGKGKPIVVLRADMDALPIQEPEGRVSFPSKHKGAMHACGHDAHTAMLLGAARILKKHEDKLNGSVWLVHQPAEEGGAGGSVMIDAGAIDGASAAFALHVLPSLPSGQFSTRVGTIMAGAVGFNVTITGRGGHAALPHLNVDPIVATAAVIQAVQTLVSRETSPLSSAVVSVTTMGAGDAFNVIPDAAWFAGTIRASTGAQMFTLRTRFQDMVYGIASTFGANSSVDWVNEVHPYYPPTVNDASAVQVARAAANSVFGYASVKEAEPLMAAEDFSFYCNKLPCTFGFLGIRNETFGSVHNLHSPNFLVDEEVLHLGTAYHVAVAMEYLRNRAGTTMSIQLPTGDSKDEL